MGSSPFLVWVMGILNFLDFDIGIYLGLSSPQHRIRLGKYKRDSDSVQREGENIQAVWSPDTKLIAILVSHISFCILNSFWLNISCVNCNATAS